MKVTELPTTFVVHTTTRLDLLVMMNANGSMSSRHGRKEEKLVVYSDCKAIDGYFRRVDHDL